MFQAGDSFIRYTKYGGIRIGEVREVTETLVFDAQRKIFYIQQGIITTNGIPLKLDGEDGRIYKIKKFLTDEEVQSRREMIEMFKKKLNIKKDV